MDIQGKQRLYSENIRRIIAASQKMDSPPSVSMMSDSSMNSPPSVPAQQIQRASPFLLPTRVSVKNESSMKKPPDSQLLKTQSEADSTDSGVSVRSDSSMSEPPNFNLQKKQSQLTEELSSCSLCEEAMKDPVPLLCGHKSCKQCVHSFRNEFGSTAEYPCKKCRRSKREKRDQDLQSVLLEKQIKRVEMETEKFQVEKEKFDLEKKKLALEIQSLELKGKYTNYDQGVVIPKTKIPYL